MPTDSTTKALLVSIVITLFYMLSGVVVAPILNTSGGNLMLNFTDPTLKMVNMALLLLSLIIGLVVSKRVQTNDEPDLLRNHSATFVLGLMSKDEKAVIDAAKDAGEITQDSLRFRLNWSKAKVSAVVAGLERRSVVQRERQGKTYSISLTKAYLQSQHGSEPSNQQKSNTTLLSSLLARVRRRKP